MPGLQLTSLVHRVRGLVGAGGDPPAGEAAPPPSARGRADEVAARILARLSGHDAERWASISVQHPDLGAVLRRELAATGRVDAAVELAEHWDTWTPAVRADVADPIHRLTHEGRQTDPTTCGSACLVLLAAAGDPGLAGWLAAGTVPRAGMPPELLAADGARLEGLARAPVTARFAVLQRVVKHRTNARSVLGLPWPASLGTPPWGAAREARFVGVPYRHRVLDDTDPADLGAVLAEVGHALDAGVPVPLYAGGDSARGWSTALPRHVVLAVQRRPDGVRVWEPSAGALVEVRTADLIRGGLPRAALGGWSHLMWAVLPQ